MTKKDQWGNPNYVIEPFNYESFMQCFIETFAESWKAEFAKEYLQMKETEDKKL